MGTIGVQESDFAARVFAAIWNADVGRSALAEDWPTCHKKGCQGSHPLPEHAFTTMKIRIVQSVEAEINYRTTTRPDVADPDESANDIAVYTLAALLSKYRLNDTWVKTARLIIDAYPGFVDALNDDLGDIA